MGLKIFAFIAFGSALLFGCQSEVRPDVSTPPDNLDQSAYVSDTVKAANRDVEQFLDFADRTDFELAERGFIATLDDTLIKTASGAAAYDFGAYAFFGRRCLRHH